MKRLVLFFLIAFCSMTTASAQRSRGHSRANFMYYPQRTVCHPQVRTVYCHPQVRTVYYHPQVQVVHRPQVVVVRRPQEKIVYVTTQDNNNNTTQNVRNQYPQQNQNQNSISMTTDRDRDGYYIIQNDNPEMGNTLLGGK